MSDQDDICRNYHGGNDESFEAHERTEPNKERDARAILFYVKMNGETGATCDECETALGLAHQTASARCSELLRDGRIIRKREYGTKIRRLTRHGCWASVYVLAGKLMQPELF